MIKIAVCDAVPHMAQQFVKIIKKYIMESNLKYEISDIDIYGEAEEIISHVEEYSIIFMDIEMPKLDGIEACRIIRKINPSILIIVTSNIIERFKETYEINTLRFITKPYYEQEIESALAAAEERISGLKTIKVFRNKYCFNLMQKDIIYIEAYESAARIHTIQGEYRLGESLGSLQNKLDDSFFIRINRSYIVNMRWIIKYDKGMMKIGKCKFRVSRGRRKEFEHKWMKYGF